MVSTNARRFKLNPELEAYAVEMTRKTTPKDFKRPAFQELAIGHGDGIKRVVDPFRRPRPMYVTCDAGLETVLTDELNALGAMKSFRPIGAGVFGIEKPSRINLECRTANRVLLPSQNFPLRPRRPIPRRLSDRLATMV